MELKFKTLEVINAEQEPIVVKKEDKFVAVSLELMSNTYVVAFDVVNEKDANGFSIEKNDYETIGVIDCYNQDGGYIDCRNDLLNKLDTLTIGQFKETYF
jgi:hypothetical protein